jgi:prepilin-type N-terminal cleavage/methylation domain-containing protein
MKHHLFVRGFTLIELIVVISIVAIVVAMAAPSFNDMIARERLRGINAELVTDLRYARSEAVQRNTRVKVKFGSTAGFTCYSVYTADIECNCQQPTRCPAGAIELKTASVPASTTVRLNAANPIVFEPARGKALANDFSAELRSTRGMALTTTVTEAGQIRSCSSGSPQIGGVPAC